MLGWAGLVAVEGRDRPCCMWWDSAGAAECKCVSARPPTRPGRGRSCSRSASGGRFGISDALAEPDLDPIRRAEAEHAVAAR